VWSDAIGLAQEMKVEPSWLLSKISKILVEYAYRNHKRLMLGTGFAHVFTSKGNLFSEDGEN
jgi:hypothetical protein